MRKNQPKTSTYLNLNAALDDRISAAYATSRLAFERTANNQFRHIDRNKFVAELIRLGLETDASFAGSRVALAGNVGKRISTQLDTLLLLLRAFLDLFCQAAHISSEQKNEAFKQAAADTQFGQHLTDFREYYVQQMDTKSSETQRKTAAKDGQK